MVQINDSPINNSSEDLLHRKDLAKYLADTIRTHDVTNSFSIAVCGKWGCGKTSFLNMVQSEFDDSDKVVFINYNPWIYTNQTDLTKEFFNTFLDTIDVRNNLIKKSKKVINAAQVGMKVVEPIFGSNAIFKQLKQYITLLSTDNTVTMSLKETRNRISDILKKTKYRFVVILDDMDRLERNEIVMLIKLVRTVADFPNVIYLLAYDEDIMSKALTTDLYAGGDYLHKLVNMSIDLPAIGDGFVPQQVMGHYKDVVGDLDERATRAILDSVSAIDTVREINLLFRRFISDYAVLRDRIDPVDLLVLDIIEVKDRDLYNAISENRSALCNGRPDMEVPQRLEKLVSILFPRYLDVSAEIPDGKRICDPKYVDGYF